MLKYNILIKITGSIAAYKTAYLISKLMQAGFQLEVVVTKSALQFIGIATLEGLIHKPIYTDVFEPGKMMSHIELTKWADLTIVVPADANTISKFSNGIADNLVTSLFLAHDQKKPYLIAPAMNTSMFKHPATQESMKKLSQWGIEILPTDKGYLACGDSGEGKMLEPDKIFGIICNHLNRTESNEHKVLITGGGTIENIDGMRNISNMSSGRTAIKIAEHFYINGAEVTLLLSESAITPKLDMNILYYNSFSSLEAQLKSELAFNEYDIVIHLAAISDYSPTSIEVNGVVTKLPLNKKLDSSSESFKIIFSKNIKLVNSIKAWSKNINTKIIAFKLLDSTDDKRKDMELGKLFKNSDANAIVFNALSNRNNKVQNSFEIIGKDGKSAFAETADDLAQELYNKWRSK